MGKTPESKFCSCNNPTPSADIHGVKFCKRCMKDLMEGMEMPSTDIDAQIKTDNLQSLGESKQDSPIVVAGELVGELECPFCYSKSAWSYPSGDEGVPEGVDDEAYCGDCDIAFKTATGAFVGGSGDPKTIQAKHKKPAKGEEKSVKIIKNNKSTEEKPFEKHYCRRDTTVADIKIICDYCTAVFDSWPSAFDHETVDAMGRPKGSKQNYSSSFSGFSSCSHSPMHIINGGEEGWNVYAGNRWGCSDKAKDFDIAINLTGDPLKMSKGHSVPLPELSKYDTRKTAKCTEIVLDWPDMGILNMGKQWWVDLMAAIQKRKAKVVVFCMGGHGRTGTAIAIMMSLSLNWSADESIKWVRKNYCKKAIETVSQLEYVYRMTGEKPPSGLTARKGQGSGSNMFKETQGNGTTQTI